MNILLNKQAEQEEDWIKHILKILLSAEEANKYKDLQHVVKTIEHEEIKELVLYHSKVVLSEIKNIYTVLGGIVNGGGWGGYKGTLDVSPQEGKRLQKLRSRRRKHNLRVKKYYLLNRYYKRLCRIYEEENSLLRQLCIGHRVGNTREVEVLVNGLKKKGTKNLLVKCGITYQVGRNFPVRIKPKWKWIRGAEKRASKPRLNLKKGTRIFRFIPHVDMAQNQSDGEFVSEEGSEPNGENQSSQVGSLKMGTSKCYIYATEAEVKNDNEMVTPNGPNDNDSDGDKEIEVELKEEEEECTEEVTQEEESNHQKGASVGEETSAAVVKELSGGENGVDVMVNEQSEQTDEVPVEEHPNKELNNGHEKKDSHLSVANNKLEQMDKSHFVESNMDKRTKLKKKKKVAERGEKEEKKKKKKNINVQHINVVNEKEEEKSDDQNLPEILGKTVEEKERVIPSQEVYHDCTH
eukprot:XP_002257982.1 hypothetical protein, conserved in Plasmodium species [Plasmodium knowlesi strain H]